MGSNPIRGMDVCVHSLSICDVSQDQETEKKKKV
jgi:hypothetical protein